MVRRASRAEWSSSVNWHYPVDTKSAYVVSLYLIFSLLTITISSLAPKLKLAAECRQPAAISDSLLWRVGSTNPWTAARTGGSTRQAAEAWGLVALRGTDWRAGLAAPAQVGGMGCGS